jgi:antitoxin ParD1/3/4
LATILKQNFSNRNNEPFASLPNFGNFEKNAGFMGRNTSISLGNHFENFIETTVSNGRFSNASEVVRAGLRLLEEEENRIIILQNAIREGIESGRSVDFDPKKHVESLKSKKK